MRQRFIQRSILFAFALQFVQPFFVDRLPGFQSVFHRRFQRNAAIKSAVHVHVAAPFIFDLRRNRRYFAQNRFLRSSAIFSAPIQARRSRIVFRFLP